MTGRRINFYIVNKSNDVVDAFTLVSSRDDSAPSSDSSVAKSVGVPTKYDLRYEVDGSIFSEFYDRLAHSVSYRKFIRRKLISALENVPDNRDLDVHLVLVQRRPVLDYGWNDRLRVILAEREELGHSMSWLSTLGGAFSALGDNFDHCAKVAGKISFRQLQIAVRLDEPPLVARCKLYLALSLIQQRRLKLARHIIEEQYVIAKEFDDFRLENMCKGVWAKLQYTHKLEKLNRIKNKM